MVGKLGSSPDHLMNFLHRLVAGCSFQKNMLPVIYSMREAMAQEFDDLYTPTI